MIAAIVLALAVVASPAPGPTPPGGWTPTPADYVALRALAKDGGGYPAGVHPMYVAKSPEEMPPFDPDAFYEGREAGAPAGLLWIWTVRHAATPERATYDALMLAAMDGDAAGPKWKAFYDWLRARDEAQTGTVADPYHYRHAFLALADMYADAAVSKPPARPIDPSLTTAATALLDAGFADAGLLVRGVYSDPIARRTVPGWLPGNLYLLYVAKGAGGKPEILESEAGLKMIQQSMDPNIPGADIDTYASMFEAAADSGAAGPVWKKRYDAAQDKLRFGQTLALALIMSGDRITAKSRADAAWVHANVKIGVSRAALVSLLATRGLKLQIGRGVDYIELPLGGNIACGSSTGIEFRFDQAGKLATIVQERDSVSCL